MIPQQKLHYSSFSPEDYSWRDIIPQNCDVVRPGMCSLQPADAPGEPDIIVHDNKRGEIAVIEAGITSQNRVDRQK